ncbi:hypothetical protein AB0D04_08340 [Streptomyces sp. NPDC048483]
MAAHTSATAIDDGLRRRAEIVRIPGTLRYATAALRYVQRAALRSLPL